MASSNPLFLWSDTDQLVWEQHQSGLHAVHQQFVQRAIVTVRSHSLLRSIAETVSWDRFVEMLQGHFHTLSQDPRLQSSGEASRQMGIAHMRAHINPSWFIAVFNEYFPAYHHVHKQWGDQLPPLSLVRTRWLWDVASALDSYNESLHREIDQKTQKVADLMVYAYKDPLTGLLNRRGLEELIERHDQLYPHEPGLLVILDLDSFKAVNDHYGHPTGDQLLKHIAIRWRSLIRAQDGLARIGGDEFGLWLPLASSPDHVIIRLRSMADAVPPSSFAFGLSGGIAQYPENGRRFQDLYHHADEALYQSKHHGKGCASTLSPTFFYPLTEK